MMSKPRINARKIQPIQSTTTKLSSSATSSLQSPPYAPPASSAPSTPPRERLRTISHGGAGAGAKPKDAEGNINVVVRCRGRSPAEIRENATLVASAAGTRGTTVILTNPSTTITTSSASSGIVSTVPIPITKTYNFGERNIRNGKGPLGNVFGPDADQGMIYNDVAKPILDQVLQGYNCTIFAYGQTGTGKTYTMEGDLSPYHGTFSPESGIIPRTLYSLFEKLAEDESEFSVRCSFVELYNEELRDLNSLESDANGNATTSGTGAPEGNKNGAAGTGGLKIYEDKNSGSGVMIQGLEETLIRNAEEGIKVLQRGSERRQIGATKCNEQSSRSHSIFTIMVHIKETAKTGPAAGEDLLKVGKLNLVDLAGSENVGRSGAEKGRAREAGMINASLLALGRVINKLVEKQSHIPYRESKLTRLLQDSLGGRTKTTIIATISPVNFEETISTLDYALRAKSIQNKPEINQRMTKGALLGQYATEIERLKLDLLAAREKNGIFFSTESWADLAAEQEARRLQLEEAKKHIEINDSQLQTTRSQFEMNLRLLGTKEEELKRIGDEVARKSRELVELANDLTNTKEELEGEEALREAFEQSRSGWKGAAGEAFQDVEGLLAKIERKAEVESSNLAVISTATAAFEITTESLSQQVSDFQRSQEEFAESVRTRLDDFATRQTDELSTTRDLVSSQLESLSATTRDILAATGSVEEHGSVFAELVERTREDLLETMAQLSLKAEKDQARMRELITTGLTEHSSLAITTIQALVQPVRQLQAEAQASLEADAERLRRIQLADVDVLAQENARLTKMVQHLTATLEQHRQTTLDEESEMISFMTSRLQARSQSTLALVDSTFNLVKDTVAANYEAQVGNHELRRSELESIEASNLRARGMLDSRTKEVELVAEEKRNELGASLRGVGESVDEYHHSVQSSAAQEVDVVRDVSSRLEAGTALFRNDASTSRALFEEKFHPLIGSAHDTYEACQSAFEISENDTVATTASIKEQLESNSTETTTYTSSTSTKLTDLRSNMKDYLETDIRPDVPTGLTPRKRDFPKDRLEPIVDLDDDRSLVRETLLRVKNGAQSQSTTIQVPSRAITPPIISIQHVVETNVVKPGEKIDVLQMSVGGSTKPILVEVNPNVRARSGRLGTTTR